MKHAREDYNRIQDPENKIPEDEPVFLLRGQDLAAPLAVRVWALDAKTRGASQDIIDAANAQADLMEKWLEDVKKKIPDFPA